MEHQTQNNKPTPSTHALAVTVMQDMQKLIKEIRAMRANVNRLLQTAPADKPHFTMIASIKAEHAFREARTDLNLWMQKHFRGGEEWLDQPEQEGQSEFEEDIFTPGHTHRMKVVQGGFSHFCDKAGCEHYSDAVSDNFPEFGEGHDEVRTDVDGDVVWWCPHPDCGHLAIDSAIQITKHALMRNDQTSHNICGEDVCGNN